MIKTRIKFEPFSDTIKVSAIALALIFSMSVSTAMGQTVHKLLHGDAAPGVAADTKVMANPNLAFHRQPVRVSAPDGTFIAVWMGEGFGSSMSSSLTGAFNIGPVYRLQVTQIHRHPGKELYPSIEVLDRLYPPQGMENNFPIEVEISQDDMEQALAGKMVTKVIYLESPETALPARRIPGAQSTIDIGPTGDVIQTAEGMGRAMAILRIGSRIPSYLDNAGEFEFWGQPVDLLPEPGMGAIHMSDDLVPGNQMFDSPVNQYPPIVQPPTNQYAPMNMPSTMQPPSFDQAPPIQQPAINQLQPIIQQPLNNQAPPIIQSDDFKLMLNNQR